MRRIGNDEIMEAAGRLASKLIPQFRPEEDIRIYPIPRGGVPAAYALMAVLPNSTLVERPQDADIILDDLIDSGATMSKIVGQALHTRPCALFTKRTLEPFIYGHRMPANEWLMFPWEGDGVGSGEDIVRRLLQYLGEDPGRGGLLETPKRVLKAWEHWAKGYGVDPASVLKTFEDGAEQADELILVRDIPVYSHCEHHLAPFFGVAHVGYIPNGKIVGLSKLSRLVDIFARRLQVQERLTNQVADALEKHLAPLGVGVILECRHLCMESRGIQQQGHRTITSAMRGALRNSDAARAEFMGMIR